MYTWYFVPDTADVVACKGAYFPVMGNGEYKTESQAIWHGKRWLRETNRTGSIEAIKASEKSCASYILDV